ncbi:Hypothetical protein, putative [Bodo saltans]|uniref:Uncharacterized protein n=1 Tax=Bodo saltans TaxID=75058 RepID=A0A0S4IS26_BODSA|nr:Hypothetical protein, putative [Bodo saltans]|eukprot:CUF58871.1 Hypothetical protein, putative [Bodo saltans]
MKFDRFHDSRAILTLGCDLIGLSLAPPARKMSFSRNSGMSERSNVPQRQSKQSSPRMMSPQMIPLLRWLLLHSSKRKLCHQLAAMTSIAQTQQTQQQRPTHLDLYCSSKALSRKVWAMDLCRGTNTQRMERKKRHQALKQCRMLSLIASIPRRPLQVPSQSLQRKAENKYCFSCPTHDSLRRPEPLLFSFF